MGPICGSRIRQLLDSGRFPHGGGVPVSFFPLLLSDCFGGEGKE